MALAQDLLGHAGGVDVGRVEQVRPASRQISTRRVASATSLGTPRLEELVAAAERAGTQHNTGILSLTRRALDSP